jgi:hypothetical protein
MELRALTVAKYKLVKKAFMTHKPDLSPPQPAK